MILGPTPLCRRPFAGTPHRTMIAQNCEIMNGLISDKNPALPRRHRGTEKNQELALCCGRVGKVDVWRSLRISPRGSDATRTAQDVHTTAGKMSALRKKARRFCACGPSG